MININFEIEKFDDKISFNIWQIQIVTVLTNTRIKKAISDKSKKPTSMIDK